MKKVLIFTLCIVLPFYGIIANSNVWQPSRGNMQSPTWLRIASNDTLLKTPKYQMAEFRSSISPIPISTQKIMKKFTWNPHCPVSLTDLVEVKVSYWGFDQKAHQGTLVVNKTLADEIVSIFGALYYHKYPIERMETMDNFKGDDNAAMKSNNTSAFNCRTVAGKRGVFSQHSYGRAIDINTLINPYVKGKKVLPSSGKEYVDRNKEHSGKITKESFIYKEFTKHGWDWGGNWRDLQDYQHFEKRANNERRNINGVD